MGCLRQLPPQPDLLPWEKEQPLDISVKLVSDEAVSGRRYARGWERFSLSRRERAGVRGKLLIQTGDDITLKAPEKMMEDLFPAKAAGKAAIALVV